MDARKRNVMHALKHKPQLLLTRSQNIEHLTNLWLCFSKWRQDIRQWSLIILCLKRMYTNCTNRHSYQHNRGLVHRHENLILNYVAQCCFRKFLLQVEKMNKQLQLQNAVLFSMNSGGRFFQLLFSIPVCNQIKQPRKLATSKPELRMREIFQRVFHEHFF